MIWPKILKLSNRYNMLYGQQHLCNMIFFRRSQRFSSYSHALFVHQFLLHYYQFLLGEKVGIRRLLAVIIGFLGVFIMMKLNTDHVDIPPFIFPSCYCSSSILIMQIMTCKLSKSSKPAALAFYIQLAFVIFSLFLIDL